eukprot:m.1651278 g.1651278  ORF g.1651278 m.1651278 type:complete len:69 (-) comp89839_c0_seq1:4-210(-)
MAVIFMQKACCWHNTPCLSCAVCVHELDTAASAPTVLLNTFHVAFEATHVNLMSISQDVAGVVYSDYH